MLSGALAGVAARTVSSPMDLLKIRFQMQSATKVSSNQCKSIPASIRRVFKNEGLKGFWKGNMAGIYLYASYSAIQFGIYDKLSHTYPNLEKGISGAMAALGATLISYPFDLIRTRKSLQKNSSTHYGNILHTCNVIFREESITGFYKGIGPSLAQVIPYMGLVFASYSRTKTFILQKVNFTNTSADFTAGCVAGLVSKTLLMPLDVVRKRLQIQGTAYNTYVIRDLQVYSGFSDCVKRIYHREGLRGFFNGLSFALLKSVPSTATTLLIYGILNRL